MLKTNDLEYETLQNQTKRLERQLKLLKYGWIVSFVVILVSIWTFQVESENQSDTLRLRRLAIVDEKGVERVVLAAPHQDPIMLGKRSKRGGDFAGVMIYDSEGNERGGYGTDEKRGALLTLDEINRAAVILSTNDKGSMNLLFSNGQGGYAALGVTPKGGWLQLEKPGQPSTILPHASDGDKK